MRSIRTAIGEYSCLGSWLFNTQLWPPLFTLYGVVVVGVALPECSVLLLREDLPSQTHTPSMSNSSTPYQLCHPAASLRQLLPKMGWMCTCLRTTDLTPAIRRPARSSLQLSPASAVRRASGEAVGGAARRGELSKILANSVLRA